MTKDHWKTRMSFGMWWTELLELARRSTPRCPIDENDPASYREYFDDGDTPEMVVLAESETRGRPA